MANWDSIADAYVFCIIFPEEKEPNSIRNWTSMCRLYQIYVRSLAKSRYDQKQINNERKSYLHDYFLSCLLLCLLNAVQPIFGELRTYIGLLRYHSRATDLIHQLGLA